MAKGALDRAFHEVYQNEPKVVGHTREKFGAERAQKQKIAIALSKARRGFAQGGSVAAPMQSSGFRSIVDPVMAMGRMSPNLQKFASRGLARKFNEARDGGSGGTEPRGVITPPGQPPAPVAALLERLKAMIQARGAGGGAPGGGMGMMGGAPPGGGMGMGPLSGMMRPPQQQPQQFAEGGPPLGGSGILSKRKQYNAYVDDMQSQGEAPLPFEDWLHEQVGGDGGQALGGETGQEQQPQSEPILDVIMHKLRSLKFARGGGVGPDPEQFEGRYYESDMIPPHTAAIAARMAQDRAIRQAMTAGTTTDDRANLDRVRAMIARIRGNQPPSAGEEGEIGSRRELFQRMQELRRRQGASSTPGEVQQQRFSAGGMVHHVNPDSNGGFSHESANGTFSYAGGGPVAQILQAMLIRYRNSTDPMERESLQRQISELRAMRMADGGPVPGLPIGQPDPSMAPPPGGEVPGGPAPITPITGGGASGNQGFDQAIGALSQLGQQLLAERASLQNSYQIPPPTQPTPPGMGMPPGAAPGGPPPGAAPPPPTGAVQEALDQRTNPVPQFARGGPISSRVMGMAARDPRMAAKLCACGGGYVR